MLMMRIMLMMRMKLWEKRDEKGKDILNVTHICLPLLRGFTSFYSNFFFLLFFFFFPLFLILSVLDELLMIMMMRVDGELIVRDEKWRFKGGR